jgi:hypothetical protein
MRRLNGYKAEGNGVEWVKGQIDWRSAPRVGWFGHPVMYRVKGRNGRGRFAPRGEPMHCAYLRCDER